MNSILSGLSIFVVPLLFLGDLIITFLKSDLNCDLFNSIDLTSGFDSFLNRIGLTGETHYDIADVLALSSELFMPLKLFKLKIGKSSSKLGF